MRGMFICKTPYQAMVALRISLTKYKSDKIDILLFDTIANVDVLHDRMQEAGVFSNIYVYKCLAYYHLPNMRRRLCPLFLRTKTFNQETYDFVFFSNILDWFVNNIIRRLRKRNAKLKVYMYEDGFSSYSKHYDDFFRMLTNNNSVLYRYYQTIYNEYNNLNGFFVFSPELLDWIPPCPVEPIEKIAPNDTEYRTAINKLFGYNTVQDVYNQEFIFFEESYFADGIDIGDTDIIEKIAEIVDKKRIFVKIHPRNPINRFKQKGFATNRNTIMPWEVIALNIDLRDKVLITIASGSALTALVNMESRPKKIIMLMDCKEIDDSKLTATLQTLRKIAYHYKGLVFTPHSFAELYDFTRKDNSIDIGEIAQ